jgi:hypothetical protein
MQNDTRKERKEDPDNLGYLLGVSYQKVEISSFSVF